MAPFTLFAALPQNWYGDGCAVHLKRLAERRLDYFPVENFKWRASCA
jgi:hypothetical protein